MNTNKLDHFIFNLLDDIIQSSTNCVYCKSNLKKLIKRPFEGFCPYCKENINKSINNDTILIHNNIEIKLGDCLGVFNRRLFNHNKPTTFYLPNTHITVIYNSNKFYMYPYEGEYYENKDGLNPRTSEDEYKHNDNIINININRYCELTKKNILEFITEFINEVIKTGKKLDKKI